MLYKFNNNNQIFYCVIQMLYSTFFLFLCYNYYVVLMHYINDDVCHLLIRKV